MRFSISATELNVPIVDTGVRVPSVDSWPDGRVRLLACRIPTICWLVIPAAAILVGSRVMNTRSSSPPVRSARATPSMASISGTISVRAIDATSSRPPLPVAAMDDTTTGEALMLSAWIVGCALAGRFALAMASVIAVVVSLTFVPNENWVTTSEIEFDEVDCMTSRRGTPLIAFSIGLVICSVTSEDPAPGYGVTTVMTGKSMSGRSSCLRLPQAEMPAKNRAPANRSVTLRLLRAIRLRRLTDASPGGWWRAG